MVRFNALLSNFRFHDFECGLLFESGSWPVTTSKRPASIWPPPVPTHSTSRPGSFPSTTTTTTTTTTKTPAQDDPVYGNYCGSKNGNQDQERIVGGHDAQQHEWPWVVALFNSGRQFCGGTLIAAVKCNFIHN